MRFQAKMWVKEVLPSPVSAILLFYKAMNTLSRRCFSIKNSNTSNLERAFYFIF